MRRAAVILSIRPTNRAANKHLTRFVYDKDYLKKERYGDMNPSIDAKTPCYHSTGEQYQQHRHSPQTGILLREQDGTIGCLDFFLDAGVLPVEKFASDGAADDHAESRRQIAQAEGGFRQPRVHFGKGRGHCRHNGVVDSVNDAREGEGYGNVGIYEDDEGVD
ncbi:hypothetical protein CORC01_14261 [Colletotrichum orchidophilum]|uniref:Uncharacterized protein n=1 Tax=Colletotrichum orchidophilum TaxID=1209926 RepID=A0A1G4AMP5_9PEZI|nr:uncharacterized protein CORC01_14261 [Colletotrichum orchidophilum]OHE90449.1 hypothetical protein CORC01_14261 [Colletotrichum orchidophilum]